VPYRELLDRLREVSDRPVVPHQYAIGRGEDLIGYIDLVTEKAYAYKAGGPSQPIELSGPHPKARRSARPMAS
jgi:elongation factor G